MTSSKLVVIFGATGAVGISLAERLSAEQSQWKIRTISRRADGSSRLEKLSLSNVTVVSGDPLEKDQVLQLTNDADIVVSCIGFHKYQAKYWLGPLSWTISWRERYNKAAHVVWSFVTISTRTGRGTRRRYHPKRHPFLHRHVPNHKFAVKCDKHCKRTCNSIPKLWLL